MDTAGATDKVSQEAVHYRDTLPDGTIVYSLPDTSACFPGGEAEMRKFIYKNLKWPHNWEGCVQGKVYLKMIIRENGEITGITVIRSLYEVFDKEAIRVVRLMPCFIPAKAGGRNVASYFVFPVSFKLI
jgi:protein TonB